jgi:hypothetical protein
MVTAWSNALTAMGETFNQSWSDIQQGRYDFSAYMKTVTSTYAASFDALMEFWKGPTFSSSPQWLHFRFDKSQGRDGTPDVLTGTVRLDKKWGRDVNLETVPFERLGQPIPKATTKAAQAATKEVSKDATKETTKETTDATDLWSECVWLDDLRRDSVDVTLNVSAVRSLPAGQYLGFVLASGTTAEPPLVIVMLQVVP